MKEAPTKCAHSLLHMLICATANERSSNKVCTLFVTHVDLCNSQWKKLQQSVHTLCYTCWSVQQPMKEAPTKCAHSLLHMLICATANERSSNKVCTLFVTHVDLCNSQWKKLQQSVHTLCYTCWSVQQPMKEAPTKCAHSLLHMLICATANERSSNKVCTLFVTPVDLCNSQWKKLQQSVHTLCYTCWSVQQPMKEAPTKCAHSLLHLLICATANERSSNKVCTLFVTHVDLCNSQWKKLQQSVHTLCYTCWSVQQPMKEAPTKCAHFVTHVDLCNSQWKKLQQSVHTLLHMLICATANERSSNKVCTLFVTHVDLCNSQWKKLQQSVHTLCYTCWSVQQPMKEAPTKCAHSLLHMLICATANERSSNKVCTLFVTHVDLCNSQWKKLQQSVHTLCYTCWSVQQPMKEAPTKCAHSLLHMLICATANERSSNKVCTLFVTPVDLCNSQWKKLQQSVHTLCYTCWSVQQPMKEAPTKCAHSLLHMLICATANERSSNKVCTLFVTHVDLCNSQWKKLQQSVHTLCYTCWSVQQPMKEAPTKCAHSLLHLLICATANERSSNKVCTLFVTHVDLCNSQWKKLQQSVHTLCYTCWSVQQPMKEAPTKCAHSLLHMLICATATERSSNKVCTLFVTHVDLCNSHWKKLQQSVHTLCYTCWSVQQPMKEAPTKCAHSLLHMLICATANERSSNKVCTLFVTHVDLCNSQWKKLQQSVHTLCYTCWSVQQPETHPHTCTKHPHVYLCVQNIHMYTSVYKTSTCIPLCTKHPHVYLCVQNIHMYTSVYKTSTCIPLCTKHPHVYLCVQNIHMYTSVYKTSTCIPLCTKHPHVYLCVQNIHMYTSVYKTSTCIPLCTKHPHVYLCVQNIHMYTSVYKTSTCIPLCTKHPHVYLCVQNIHMYTSVYKTSTCIPLCTKHPHVYLCVQNIHMYTSVYKTSTCIPLCTKHPHVYLCVQNIHMYTSVQCWQMQVQWSTPIPSMLSWQRCCIQGQSSALHTRRWSRASRNAARVSQELI